MTVYKWDKAIPGNNATADTSIQWQEGMPSNQVNDSARGVMTAVAKYRDDIAATITTTGTNTAYQVATNQVFDTLAHLNGAMIGFVPHATSGAGAITMQVDGIASGAKPLRIAPGVELSTGQLIAGVPYVMTYNNASGVFYLQGVAAQVAPTAGSITLSMLASNSVDASKIVDGSVGTAELATDAVTNVKILANTIAAGKLAAGSVALGNLITDTGNKGKIIGYDISTGAPTTFNQGGPLLHVREEQASGGASASTFTLNTWVKQALNQAPTAEIPGNTLGSSQIGLPAGTYFLSATAMAYVSGFSTINNLKSRLRDVTNNVTKVVGFSSQNSNVFGGSGVNHFDTNMTVGTVGRFTLAGSATLELQMWTGSTVATAPQPVSSGEVEVYANVLIWRVG